MLLNFGNALGIAALHLLEVSEYTRESETQNAVQSLTYIVIDVYQFLYVMNAHTLHPFRFPPAEAFNLTFASSVSPHAHFAFPSPIRIC